MGATITNRELGELIGLTHSSVSRIRSGHRWPSIDAMRRIEAVLGWKVDEQIRLRPTDESGTTGRYAKELERRVNRYIRSRDKQPAPA